MPGPGLMRASSLRLSPLLLLAAALVALAAFFAPGAQPAQAQTTTVWSATLTVSDEGGGLLGCGPGNCSDALTDSDFKYKGVDYRFVQVLSAGGIQFALDKRAPGTFHSSLTLIVDGRELALKSRDDIAIYAPDGGNGGDQVVWYSLGLSWSVGDTIFLALVEIPPQIIPDLDRLPVDYSVEPVPPSQRRPTGTGASASDAYCYLGEGNSATEYVRYPDGRIAETVRQSDYIRRLFACE